MFKKVILSLISGSLIVGMVMFLILQADEKTDVAKKPSLPEIPGITIEDAHPNGCVDCHKNYPEYKMDVRFSTLIKAWSEKVGENELVNIAKATAPKDVKIVGKHPDISDLIKKEETKIPAICLGCHAHDSKVAPSFVKMVHLIHLTTEEKFTGKENHFLMNYQGFCTNCHVMDKDTGKMTLKIGSEQK